MRADFGPSHNIYVVVVYVQEFKGGTNLRYLELPQRPNTFRLLVTCGCSLHLLSRWPTASTPGIPKQNLPINACRAQLMSRLRLKYDILNTLSMSNQLHRGLHRSLHLLGWVQIVPQLLNLSRLELILLLLELVLGLFLVHLVESARFELRLHISQQRISH